MSLMPPPASADTSQLEALIVAHGPGRGRATSYLDFLESTIASERPDLNARVRIHRTGGPAPDLSGVGVVVFVLGDPLQTLYPQCFEEASDIHRRAAALGIRCLNPPAALNNTTKSRQAQLWRAAGIDCAHSQPLASEAEMRDFVRSCRWPQIVRFDHGHAQENAFVCRSRGQALQTINRMRFPAVAIEFIDVRSAWREADPTDLRAVYFHKKRAFVFGNSIVNGYLHFSWSPMVSSYTSSFFEATRRRGRWLGKVGIKPYKLKETIKADCDFAAAFPESPRQLLEAARALELDFAAIDYASFPDGRCVLWEANPFFGLAHWLRAPLWQARGLKARHLRICAAAIDQIESALKR